MSYTNTTEFYNIPLPGEEDLVNPMDDNDAKEAVDTALHGAVTNAENAVSTANSASDAAAAAVSGLEDLSGTVNTEKGKLTALTARVTAAENEIDDVRSDTSDMICAFNEPSATSTHAYSIGDYFIYNNVLYKATAPIAINDTIVPNTNCAATNVTSELESGASSPEANQVSLAPITGMVADDVQEGIEELNTSLSKKGNVRYYNGNLQQYNGSTWVNVQIGGSMPTLNYLNPLHNFTTGNLTFTATKECYLTGTVVAGSAITGNVNNANIIYNGSSGVTGFISPIKLMNGDVVTVSAACANLYIFDVVS